MRLVRRRVTAGACFGLLALLTELTGHAVTVRLDRALQVSPFATPTTDYYPFLLAGVRTLAAVVIALVTLRAVRAHVAAAAGERLLGRITHRPRFRVRLSLRLWGYAFVATSLFYLAQNDAAGVATGRWPLLAPWLHTYALPVFAVCSLLLALGFGAVRTWLADVERYAASTLARASRLLRAGPPRVRRHRDFDDRAPRRLYGVLFESRPPPLPA